MAQRNRYNGALNAKVVPADYGGTDGAQRDHERVAGASGAGGPVAKQVPAELRRGPSASPPVVSAACSEAKAG